MKKAQFMGTYMGILVVGIIIGALLMAFLVGKGIIDPSILPFKSPQPSK